MQQSRSHLWKCEVLRFSARTLKVEDRGQTSTPPSLQSRARPVKSYQVAECLQEQIQWHAGICNSANSISKLPLLEESDSAANNVLNTIHFLQPCPRQLEPLQLATSHAGDRSKSQSPHLLEISTGQRPESYSQHQPPTRALFVSLSLFLTFSL